TPRDLPDVRSPVPDVGRLPGVAGRRARTGPDAARARGRALGPARRAPDRPRRAHAARTVASARVALAARGVRARAAPGGTRDARPATPQGLTATPRRPASARASTRRRSR